MADFKWDAAGRKRWLTAVGTAAGVFCLTFSMAAGAAGTKAAQSASETEIIAVETENEAIAAETENEAIAADAGIEAAVVDSKVARVYPGTLDSKKTLTTYELEGQEDVPYVSLQEYLDLAFSDFYIKTQEYSWKGNTYQIKRNGQTVDVDLDTQTFICEDWNNFYGPNGPECIPAGIVTSEEFIAIRSSEVSKSNEDTHEGYEVDLNHYGAKMFRLDDQVLCPFVIAQNIFMAPNGANVLAYNGDDYYDIVTQVGNIYGTALNSDTKNPYADKWYSGRFASMERTTEAYAKYNYGSLCLLLDLLYGHKEEKGIVDFDLYLEEKGLKKRLLSTDPKDHRSALEMIFVTLFDSGHDGEMLSPSIFDSSLVVGKAELVHSFLDLIGYDSIAHFSEDWIPIAIEVGKLLGLDPNDFLTVKPASSMEDISSSEGGEPEIGPNVEQMMIDVVRMQILKPFLYGSNNIEIIDDTCVIYFESFIEDLKRTDSYYVKLPNKSDLEKSTFSLLYYAFSKIQEAGNVKKVVFDVSNNGGGSAAALISALGFLSDDGEVEFTYRDILNKSYRKEYYHIDTNLDGVFDDQDGYGGEYEFYIMTSGYSYSCANALPYFAQKQGLAKIIGEKPGGGDCVVNYYLDANGHVASMSGHYQLGTLENGVFESDEKAVEVDMKFPVDEADDIYFNPEAIAEFVNR